MITALYPAIATAALLAVWLLINHDAATVPAAPAPAAKSTCADCGVPVPAGRTWCSWVCRNRDDRHDQPEIEGTLMRNDDSGEDSRDDEDTTPDAAEQAMAEDGFTSYRRFRPVLSTVPQQLNRRAS